MSELTEQVDDYIQTIIKDAITGFASRAGVAFHYRDHLIHLITEAAVMAVSNVAGKELETSTPQDGEATAYYKIGYVQGCGASFKAIRALSEVKE